MVRHRRAHALIGAVSVAVLLCLLHLACSPSMPVLQDELYHLLAGRSWAETGTFRIEGGEYRRGLFYTLLVGEAISVTGHGTLFVARLVSMAATAGLVASLFFWMHRRVGAIAAWGMAILLLLNDEVIRETAFARFYTLQALALWIGVALLYGVVTGPWRKIHVVAMAAAVAALALSAHLQVTTVIPVAAFAGWILVETWLDGRLGRLLRGRRGRWVASTCLVVLAMVAAAVLYRFGRPLVAVPGFQTSRSLAPFFYIRHLVATMPLPILALPVAIALGWRVDPRMTRFACVMFLLPLLVHSLAARKEYRYLLYAYPYLFILWGLALERVRAGFARRRGVRASALPVAALLAVLVLSSPGPVGVLGLFGRGVAATWRDPSRVAGDIANPPWLAAAPVLRRLADAASIVLTAHDMKTLYHVGRADMMVSASWLGEVDPPRDFTRDFRTGMPVVGTAAALDLAIRCTRNGLLIVPDTRWRSPAFVTARMADRVEASASPVRPAVPGFRVFRWRGGGDPAGCAVVRRALMR